MQPLLGVTADDEVVTEVAVVAPPAQHARHLAPVAAVLEHEAEVAEAVNPHPGGQPQHHPAPAHRHGARVACHGVV